MSGLSEERLKEVRTFVDEGHKSDPEFPVEHYIRAAVHKFKLTTPEAMFLAEQYGKTIKDLLGGKP